MNEISATFRPHITIFLMAGALAIRLSVSLHSLHFPHTLTLALHCDDLTLLYHNEAFLKPWGIRPSFHGCQIVHWDPRNATNF